ncbi:MAG: hypothetical protein LE178_05505 [Endomicrobium sp.]|nr:hypothetical protein [Endomicrobium sp.]
MRIKVGGEDDGGEPPIPYELFNVHIGVRYVNLEEKGTFLKRFHSEEVLTNGTTLKP